VIGPRVSDGQHDDEVVAGVRRRVDRRKQWEREGDPTLARQFACVGVLGWLIVIPALLGAALGRWLDGIFASGIVFSAGLLFAGLALGCWSGWRWMQER